MLILAIIGFGMAVGGLAQFIVDRDVDTIDWGMALIAGIAGSFVGGLTVSLIAGDELAIRPSGLIGSIIGAIIVTALWKWIGSRRPRTADSTRRR
jgi:uncharacterized membrane protein YeaQ/YmgE (transglycosylase-associated protein family)